MLGPEYGARMPVADAFDRPRFGNRSLFPDLEARAYLAHAAVSPPPLPVRRAVIGAVTELGRRGLEASREATVQRRRLKVKLAELVGGSADDYGLVGSTTQAVAAAALCFPWRRGDKVILVDAEFPANVTPWLRAAELYGLNVAWLPQPLGRTRAELGEFFEALERELRSGARLFAASAVQFQTGLRLPIAELAACCKRHGTEIFVDVIQAAGSSPFDVRTAGVDYAAGAAHKWLMGVEGVGYLYVHPDRVASLRPVVAGWASHVDPFSFLVAGAGHLHYDKPIRRSADFVEGGGHAGVACAALEAGIDTIAALGTEGIWRHVNAYLDRLEPALCDLGFESARATDPALRSCLFSVRPPSFAPLPGLYGRLRDRGVACSTPDGWLRFAPHWPNSPEEEVDLVIEATREALSELQR